MSKSIHLINSLGFDILSFPSKNYNSRSDTPIRAIITHCIGVSLETVFELFQLDGGISAHYFVPQIAGNDLQKLMPDEFGNYQLSFPNQVPVIQFVRDENRAYHAGISSFGEFNNLNGCEKSLNSCTIGIEFHSPGYANGDGSDWYKFTEYTDSQKDVGIKLVSYLMKEHDIPSSNLFAHSTISPGRKTDPGALFFWEALNKVGLGYIPKSKPLDNEFTNELEKIIFIQNKLKYIGFVECPQNGELDVQTHNHLDSYVMQFATELWTGQNIEITEELIGSINGFDISFLS